MREYSEDGLGIKATKTLIKVSRISDFYFKVKKCTCCHLKYGGPVKRLHPDVAYVVKIRVHFVIILINLRVNTLQGVPIKWKKWKFFPFAFPFECKILML